MKVFDFDRIVGHFDEQTEGDGYHVLIHTKSGNAYSGAWYRRGGSDVVRLDQKSDTLSDVFIEIEQIETIELDLP